MSQIVLDSMVRVPVDALTIRQLRKIRTGLKLRMPSHNGRYSTEVKAYVETNGTIGLPRQWPGSRKILKRNPYLDHRSRGTPIKVKFHSDEGWREGQEDFLLDVVEGLEDDGLGGIGEAKCGFGKTVLACAIIAEMGVTTLILVHTETIRDQWLKAIRTFLGVEAGVVQGGICQFEGFPVAVAMLHSLKPDKYPPEFYTWPGLIVADECHHMSARTFWNAIIRFPAQYFLGLTATARRADNLEDIFFWTIGDIIAEGEGETLPCKVRQIIYEPDVSWSELQPDCGKCDGCERDDYCDEPKDPAYWKLLEWLAQDPELNGLITRLATKAARSDRKALLLSGRLDQIDRVLRRLRCSFKRRGEPYTAGHFKTGKTKKIKAEKIAAAQATICLGTDRMVKEGFDVPGFDTLILAAPMKDPEQAIGRIQRILQGKKQPVVLDIHIDHPFCHNANNERLAFYRKERWPVRALKYDPRTGRIRRLRRRR